MNERTINNEVTMGGASATLLAGRYRVVKQLGQGGMGSVWLAEDTKLDNHQVAIKMLPSILVNNKRAYAQVKQEALVSLKLSHSNIATVRAFEEEGGNPFLVMDYIDGQSLDDCLAEKGTLTEEETVKLLKPVAAALDYAHGQGVVHRDVKPGNIMIAKDGTPYVLDFGIAREIQETMTRVTGKLSSGTLLYMSPEQLNGEAPKPAQDIYSFAAMAYECLKGEPPFVRGGIEDQIKHKMPDLLDERIAICSQVMAGIAKQPEARPASCAAVLEGGGASKTLLAAKPSAPERKSRARGWVAAMMLILVAAGIGGSLWREKIKSDELAAERAERKAEWDKSKFERQKAEQEAQAARQEAERLREDAKRKAEGSGNLKDDGSMTEDDKRRRNELRQLTMLKTKVGIKVSEARANCEKASTYRQDKEGFEGHLAEIDRQWALIDKEWALDTPMAATNAWREVSEAADAIAFELNWLKTNREGRDAAQRIAREIADELDEPLKKFKADDVAKSTFARGMRERAAAAEALGRGEFTSAKERYEAAKATLDRALQAARAFFVETTIAVAKEYCSARNWQACLNEAEKVLGWESANAEAAALKAEAESHLKPMLRIVAKIGEREVPATAIFNGKACLSPWRWDEGLKEGSRFPSADVAVEYSEGGKRYMGAIKPETIDWKGPRTITVVLTEYKGPKVGDTKTITLPGGATMEMVWCPPESFIMGSPSSEEGRFSDETQHRVTLTEGFWMGKYEVTQRQWESVMGENPSYFKGSDRPVERVSWNDCQKFIRKINAAGRVTVSLPTEAQWEYACRAGTTTPFNFGSTLNGDKANCDGNYPCGTAVKGRYHRETAVVGSYAPNAWGLYDMHGNVYEWCADWYGDYADAATDPTGPASGTDRVLRGGCWLSLAQDCRSAFRNGIEPGNRYENLGLRLVCSLP